MPLGTEVGLGPGDTVLDGDPAPPTERGTAAPAPHFSAHFALVRSPISATAELLFSCSRCYHAAHDGRVRGRDSSSFTCARQSATDFGMFGLSVKTESLQIQRLHSLASNVILVNSSGYFSCTTVYRYIHRRAPINSGRRKLVYLRARLRPHCKCGAV